MIVNAPFQNNFKRLSKCCNSAAFHGSWIRVMLDVHFIFCLIALTLALALNHPRFDETHVGRHAIPWIICGAGFGVGQLSGSQSSANVGYPIILLLLQLLIYLDRRCEKRSRWSGSKNQEGEDNRKQ